LSKYSLVLGYFELIGFNEEVKFLLCVLSGFCHPDIMDILFCFGLTVFRELVKYVCRFMNPAILTAGLAKDFSNCFSGNYSPEASRVIVSQ
jgi:hypothetical protein